MYGYIYETTDLRNGKTYIGQHKSNKFEPKYLGSGSRLIDRIKKYGRKQLEVKLLATAENQQELDKLEKQFISEARKRGKAEYNVANGGQGKATILNCRWMFKNDITIPVPPELEETYLKEGYTFGRATPAHNTGKVGVHKINPDGTVVNKYISESNLDSYLNNGWKAGFDINYKPTSTKGFIWIHKDDRKKMIPLELRNNFPDWEDGIGNHTNNGVSEKYIKDSIWIHKGEERKRIQKSDKHLYPDWEEGIGEVGPRKEKQMWIHKGNTKKFIYVSERSQYPDWKDGQSSESCMWIHKNDKQKFIQISCRDDFSDWEDGKLDPTALKGKFMWIHKDKECKFIPVSERENFLDWEDGQGRGTRKQSIPTGKYIWINNGIEQTRILKENLSDYPDWNKGKLKGTHMWIHNDKESKFILKVDREKYPNWINGHL